MRWIAALVLFLLPATPAEAADGPAEWAEAFETAVREANEEHRKKPGKKTEDELAAALPRSARQAFDRVFAAPAGAGRAAALERVAEAALDLAMAAGFDRARERIEEEAPERAAALGVVVVRERFLLRCLGGLSQEYAARLADLIDEVLRAYDEVFGFEEWSKVPGKRIRFRVHREERIERPPHFAPQFPFHSEVDFPVVDRDEFRSPTPDGKFLFYGLCHELGHVIAMWGDRDTEEDHHAWAHDTGVAIVEHLSKEKRSPLVKDLRDLQWRSLELERKAAEGKEPSTASREGVMALLLALHDEVGPRAIGDGIDLLDDKDERLRVNGVRYYTFKEFRGALLEGTKSREKRKTIERLLR
jgi:hypothetical protein